MSAGRRQLLVLMTVAAIMLPATVVMAISASMSSNARVRTAITLTPTAMQIGTVSFSANPSGASDFVKLGTDGSRTFGGVFSAGGGTVNAGDVLITGSYGQVLDVACSATARMTTGAAPRIDITGIEVAAENSTGAYGTKTACTGIGNNVMSFTLTLTTNDNLKVGGKVDGATAASWTSGTYSTSSAGGTNISVNITYN